MTQTTHSPLITSTHVIPLLLHVPLQWHRSWPDLMSPPLLPTSVLPWNFSGSLNSYLSLSTSLQLVFSKNCSKCRYIFHFFVREKWILFFPLHHRDRNPPLVYIFLIITKIANIQSKQTIIMNFHLPINQLQQVFIVILTIYHSHIFHNFTHCATQLLLLLSFYHYYLEVCR